MSKPTKSMRQTHAARTMTARQAARVKSGKLESVPSDYQKPSEAGRKLGIARRNLEDRQIDKDLGIE